MPILIGLVIVGSVAVALVVIIGVVNMAVGHALAIDATLPQDDEGGEVDDD